MNKWIWIFIAACALGLLALLVAALEAARREDTREEQRRIYAEMTRERLKKEQEERKRLAALAKPVNCHTAEHDFLGCLGYGRHENDDEPVEQCKRCELYTGNIAAEEDDE